MARRISRGRPRPASSRASRNCVFHRLAMTTTDWPDPVGSPAGSAATNLLLVFAAAEQVMDSGRSIKLVIGDPGLSAGREPRKQLDGEAWPIGDMGIAAG